MKKLLAIIIVCVCSASVSMAQDNGQKQKMHPRFELLDSASRSQMMKDRHDWWQKQKKENEKKWKKHVAFWHHPHHRHGNMARHNFALHKQEKLPEFIGGKEALMSWIKENITYPIQADVKSIEGKVVVTFDVNRDGSIGNVKVKESADPILDKEVVSKIESMPRWIPAFQNGRTVKVKYTLPISFVEAS